MPVSDKVHEYLKTHKTPVTATELANRFLVNPNTVFNALRRLELRGHVKRHKLGKQTHWTFKPTPFDGLAVPQSPAPGFRPPAIKTSYPNIRGYDD